MIPATKGSSKRRKGVAFQRLTNIIHKQWYILKLGFFLMSASNTVKIDAQK